MYSAYLASSLYLTPVFSFFSHLRLYLSTMRKRETTFILFFNFFYRPRPCVLNESATVTANSRNQYMNYFAPLFVGQNRQNESFNKIKREKKRARLHLELYSTGWDVLYIVLRISSKHNMPAIKPINKNSNSLFLSLVYLQES